ncbi:MAG: redoxin domain-containing protein [Hyphomicrobiaceae bacterium]
MVGFAEQKAELDALGIKVAAASVDPIDKAKEVADEVNFPVGYGVTKDVADKLGSWWEERRQIIQPTELMLNGENQVVGSSYADGPLGRIQATEIISLIKIFDSRAK